MIAYRTVEQLLDLLDEPNRSACLRLYRDNRVLFQQVPGSAHNHQAWEGGYHDHVQEVMNIAVFVYDGLRRFRWVPFSLSDLLLVLFLHDLEKPWKYERRGDGRLRFRRGMEHKEDHRRFREAKLVEYGIVLNAMQKNGLEFVEGEIHDYSTYERRMSPLAAAAHMCDVCSARVWFDHPLADGDPWIGASRQRDF